MTRTIKPFVMALAILLAADAHARQITCSPPVCSVKKTYYDTRCCTTAAKDSAGEWVYNKDVIAAFQLMYPCPSNLKTTGECPGWMPDFVIPLDCGGQQEISNMQWLPFTTTPIAGIPDKSDFETKTYCKPYQIVPGITP